MQLTILDFTINRKDELKKLIRNQRKNIPTLILGKSGIGKTHILYELMSYLRERKVGFLYVEKFKPVKETLINLHKSLNKSELTDKEEKSLKRLTSSELSQGIILTLEARKLEVRKKDFMIIFDHLEDVTSSTADILMKLSSLTLVFGAGQFVRRVRSLRRFFWQFEIIEIEPLSKEDSVSLVEKLIKLKKLNIKCRNFFINQIVTNTGGIPLSIIETINRAKTKGKVTRTSVRDMFIHASGVKEIDASPFIMLMFAFFIVMRFVYRGFGEFQGYAMFGALTGLGMFVRYMLYRSARRPRE